MNIKTVQVAPFAGAWIEITGNIVHAPSQRVAPFAGEWIEIAISEIRIDRDKSLPSRERGLK